MVAGYAYADELARVAFSLPERIPGVVAIMKGYRYLGQVENRNVILCSFRVLPVEFFMCAEEGKIGDCFIT